MKIVTVAAALYFPALFFPPSLAVCIFVKKIFLRIFQFLLAFVEGYLLKTRRSFLPLLAFTGFSCLEKKILEVAAAKTEKAKVQRCMNQG